MFTKDKRLKSRSVSPLGRTSDRHKMNEKALKLTYSMDYKKLLAEQDQRTSETVTSATTTLKSLDITSIGSSATEDIIAPSTTAPSPSTKNDENNFKKYFKITQNITNDKNLDNTKRKNHHIKRAIVDPQQVVLQRRLGEGVKPLFDRDDVKVNKNCANKVNNKRDSSSSSSDSSSDDNGKSVITNRKKSLTPKRDWKYDKSPSKTKQVSSTSHKTTHKSRSRSYEKQSTRRYRSNKTDSSTRKHYSRSRSQSPPIRKPYHVHNNRNNTNNRITNRRAESPKLSYYVDDKREEDRLRQKYGIDRRRDNKTRDHRNVTGSRRSRSLSPRDNRKRKSSSSRKRARSQSSEEESSSNSRKQTVPMPPHPYVPPMAVYPPPYGYAPYMPVDPMWMSAPPRQYIPRPPPPFIAPHYIGPPPPPHMFRPRMPCYRPNYNRYYHPRNR